MSKRVNKYIEYANCFGIDFSACTFLGQGRCGRVFLMPDGRVIKIFKDEESCIHEYTILESVRGNKHFPRVYECEGNCMIREYVNGICLIDYVKTHGLSKRLSVNLVNLIEDFKRLGFTRLDMRCSHIFVQHDESVTVIDPRKHYTIKTSYPRSILVKFKKLHIIGKFMNILKEEHPAIYSTWKKAV